MIKLAGMEAELRSNTAKKEQLEADIALCSVKLVLRRRIFSFPEM